MPRIILFRCPSLRLDDLASVHLAETIEDVEAVTVGDSPLIVLIGSAVRRSDATRAIEIAARHGGYFLRLRAGDREAWIRRLVGSALRRTR